MRTALAPSVAAFFVTLVSAVALGCSSNVQGTGAPSSSDPNEPTFAAGGTQKSPDEAAQPIPDGAKRVFVTSAAYTAEFRAELGSSATGVIPADGLCQAAADAAMIGGTWRAYVEFRSTSANDRIEGTGPWYSMKGTKIFNNKANLVTRPLAPLDVDELGARVLSGDAWTGVGSYGHSSDASNCGDWSYGQSDSYGQTGRLGAIDQSWRSASAYTPCSHRAHLYCFEQ